MSAPPADPAAAIEAQEEGNVSVRSDDDSGFDEAPLSTASLQSSVFDYEIQNGRSYHAFRKGKYVMPNDEGELDRMDIHYHAVRRTLGDKHFLAPIENPAAVLDVGTGTGIWAMDVADDFPSAQVRGIDLSPTQPTAVPPNLEFSIMDADEEWDFTQKFDLVHTRLMNGFSIKSWPFFYQQAFESMEPGGWVENQEFDLNFACDDGTQPPDSAVLRWQKLWHEGINNFGLTGVCDPHQMKLQLEEAGFINCSIKSFKLPIGIWPKDRRLREVGQYMMVGIVEGATGLTVKVFTQGLGWSVEEMEVLLMEVRAEWSNRKVHAYLPLHVVMGQKPATANG